MDPIEVFGVGPDGELIEIRGRADRAWAGKALDDGGPGQANNPIAGYDTEIGADHRHQLGYRARPGQRPGGYEDRKSRTGGREDVITPVPVLPGPASRALHTGEPFREPLPGVTVDLESLKIDARGSSWNAVVDCGRFRRRRRRATLRAYPSPSLNLTILELVPNRPRLVHTRAFVNTGIDAIDTLGRRLTRVRASRLTTG